MPKLTGDDTKTKITILDEDQPGTICFEDTQLDVKRTNEFIEMKILRVDGADGAVSCTVRTQPCQQTKGLDVKRAEEFEDYIPFKETIEFKQNETEQTIKIKLC